MEENNKPEFGTRETGMFVPDGFFAEFQKDLEKKIDQKVHRHIIIQRWSIAASICILVGLIPAVCHTLVNSSQPSETVMVAENTVEATEDFSSEELFVSTVSDYDIYETFYADL